MERYLPSKPNIKRSGKIPFLDGRPERELSITRDDVVNLMIALEINEDVTDFLKDKFMFRQEIPV